jgi:small-conductance mechanosensitive channel/CRP-like cAMP-binding protein
MSAIFGDAATTWSAVLILLLPLVVIGAGELEERLRQRDSALGPPVGLLRTWVVPLFVVWTVVRTLFGLSGDHPVVVVLGSALVVAVAATVLSLLRIVVARLAPGGGAATGRRPLPALVLALPRIGVILFTAWLLVSGVWDVDLSAALTALGVTSLVVSLALQDPLSSLASGFLLLSDQPFQPGDWIRVDDLEGEVVDLGWRTSRIRTRSGDIVVVPNGALAKATITNMSQPSTLHRLEFPVQVAFANAPTRAKEMLLAAARATPGVLTDPPPAALVTQVDDPLMGYVVHLWIDDVASAPRIRSDFGSLVWYHSHRYDVPLPSPAQDLYLYDGAKVAEADRVERAELLRRLRRSPVLDQLDDDELDELGDAAQVRRYARGEVIVGDEAEGDLQVLHRGRAALLLRDAAADRVVLDLGEGELFGVLDHRPDDGVRTAIVATEDCEVVTVPASVALPLASRTPRLSEAIDQLAASRRRRVAHTVQRRMAASSEAGSSDGVALP